MQTAESKTKRTEYERLRVRAGALLDEYPNGLPGAKATEFNDITTKMGELETDIKSAEEAEDRKLALVHADKFLNDPIRKLPHGVNGDDDDRKALLARGWEFKGGMAYAPNTLEGTTYRDHLGNLKTIGKTPMFGEDVLFGEIPKDDPVQAEFYKTTRASMGGEYQDVYVKLWRSLARSAGEMALALQKLSPSEQKALAEGTDVSGGFLVPPDTQADILARTAQAAVMRRLARVQTTTRDILRWMMVAPHASSGSIYSSGFVGGWAGETPAFSDTDPGFQLFDVPIKKIRVATKPSNDLIMDAAFNVLAFLATDGARNMALVEDSGFLTGDGTALQPMGILNSGATTFDVEGSTANTISNTTSDAGSAPKIISGVYQIPDQYVEGSVMVVRRAIEGKLAGLVDGNGRPFWPANAGGGFDLPQRRIEGLPLFNSSFMPTDGTDANKVILEGNIAQAYIIGQRAQITTTVLRERFAETDQTGIILWERVGGATWNVDAIRIGIV